MTGNKPRRGLADFLSRELKAPPPPAPVEEVRTPVTDRVSERQAPVGKRREEPAEPRRETPPPPAASPRIAPGAATTVQGVAPGPATTTQTREVRKPGTSRDRDDQGPEVTREPKVTKSVSSEVRESDAGEEEPEARAEVRTAEVTKPRTHRVDDDEPAVDDPLYLRLTRKEVRFRDEQMEGLHRLARRLSKARRGMKGDRITDNTLVRVAVDLLLQHADDLAGHDEATLLESLRRLSRKRG